MPTDYFPANFNRVWLRGRFIDLGKAARNERKIGYYGSYVTFTPDAKTLTDSATMQIMVVPTFSASPEIVGGYWSVQVPATNDPDVNPVGWTYTVQEPTGRHYSIEVPYDTPVLHDAADPLDGQRVIELSDVSPTGSGSGGTIQLLQGRGISTMAIVGGHLIVTFSDEVESDLGPLPVWAINQASDYDGTPAPTSGQFLAYNSGSAKWEPTTLSTVSTFDGAAIVSGTVGYNRLPVGTTASHVPAADDSRLSDARTPLTHTHSAADVVAGSLNISRIPTGTTAGTCALGNHVHAATDITSGILPFGQIPTGTTSTTAAIGNHTHSYTGQVTPSWLTAPVTLTDAATVATDASLGFLHRVSITANRTLGAPSNPTDGQRCTWAITASGADRALTLTTTAGGFDISDQVATTTVIKSGQKMNLEAVYNSTANLWFVVRCTPQSEPVCTVTLGTSTAMPSTASSAFVMTFPVTQWSSTATVDTHSMYHYNQTSDTWIQVPFAGRWRVHVRSYFTAIATGKNLGMILTVNGSEKHNMVVPALGVASNPVIDASMDNAVLASGDKIRTGYYSDSNSAGASILAGGDGTHMTVTYLGAN